MNLAALNTARHHRLNLTDLQVLHMLAEQGPQDLTAIAAETSLTTASITYATQKLSRLRLIQRRKLAWADARLVIIELSELGRVRIHQLTGTFPVPAGSAEPQLGSSLLSR